MHGNFESQNKLKMGEQNSLVAFDSVTKIHFIITLNETYFHTHNFGGVSWYHSSNRNDIFVEFCVKVLKLLQK